jgi:hypothetical protein
VRRTALQAVVKVEKSIQTSIKKCTAAVAKAQKEGSTRSIVLLAKINAAMGPFERAIKAFERAIKAFERLAGINREIYHERVTFPDVKPTPKQHTSLVHVHDVAGKNSLEGISPAMMSEQAIESGHAANKKHIGEAERAPQRSTCPAGDAVWYLALPAQP